ncbi:hypothetical protein RchiOBHm_Chr7g0182191 [Rosa chinensis]|uniref:Uncharacterized protein n=1 Tax=Rosa chinensis TaxID=74649 RepID=A0A2P6P2V7_ROSCH|nr:hypothetical protein RchiOBHm_Chr7g0182191 [Rosa chinensis]
MLFVSLFRLLLGLFLNTQTPKFPDFFFFLLNRLLSLWVAFSGGPYPFPSALICKYALWSSVLNGVCPLVHRVMQQGSEHPLDACPLDPFVDPLTSLSLQLVFLVDLLAEDVLRFGDGLGIGFLVFESGLLLVRCLIRTTMGLPGLGPFVFISLAPWIWSCLLLLSACTFGSIGWLSYLLLRGCVPLLTASTNMEASGLDFVHGVGCVLILLYLLFLVFCISALFWPSVVLILFL